MFRVALILFFAFGAACARQQPPKNAADTMRAQFNDDWKYWMEQYPEAATLIGYPGQNARWTDYSQSAIDARSDYLKKSLERVSAIDRSALPADDHVNYDLYRELLDSAVKGLDSHNDAAPVRGVIPRNLLMPIRR